MLDILHQLGQSRAKKSKNDAKITKIGKKFDLVKKITQQDWGARWSYVTLAIKNFARFTSDLNTSKGANNVTKRCLKSTSVMT